MRYLRGLKNAALLVLLASAPLGAAVISASTLHSCGSVRDLTSTNVITSRVQDLAVRVGDRAIEASPDLQDEVDAVLQLLEDTSVPEWRLRGPVQELCDGHDIAWFGYWSEDPVRVWRGLPLNPDRVHQHFSESNSLRYVTGLEEKPLLEPEALAGLLQP